MSDRGPEIVHVADEEIQVLPESEQLDIGCNRELLELPSDQIRQGENVVIAILPGLAAGPRPVGDDGDRLTGSPDTVDEIF